MEAALANPASTPRKRDSLRSFALFLFVGVLNTLVGYGLFAALVFAGMVPELSLLFATVLGVAFNFFTTGKIVFADNGSKRFVRFVAVYAGVYALNAIALRLLIMTGIPAVVGQSLLLPITVLLTFVALRTYVFQGKPQ